MTQVASPTALHASAMGIQAQWNENVLGPLFSRYVSVLSALIVVRLFHCILIMFRSRWRLLPWD